MWDWLRETFRFLTDVQALITWGGTAMVCTIVFVETGLFFGFFLPGDSLLVSAGIFAAAGYLDVRVLLIGGAVCAVVGDQVGYVIGRTAGQALYSRPDSFFFRRRHLERAHDFYEKYGGKTIVLARFVPIVRTFAPAVAGAAQMNYRGFVTYNVVGGVLWVFSMVLLGYSLGRLVPNINRYIHLVIAVVIFLSILPGIIEFWRERKKHAAARNSSAAEIQPERD
jgi:membrane-associated protein